jgi:hypothetical protein
MVDLLRNHDLRGEITQPPFCHCIMRSLDIHANKLLQLATELKSTGKRFYTYLHSKRLWLAETTKIEDPAG